MRNSTIMVAAAFAAALGACAPDQLVDATADGDPGPNERPSLLDAENAARVLDAFETPGGGRIEFVEVHTGDAGGVLVVEQSGAGGLTLDRLSRAAGGPLNATDVYHSLMHPSDDDGTVLSRIVELAGPVGLERPRGWGIDVLHERAPVILAASRQVACDNEDFTSSVPGGFLPQVKKRLDTGPDLHPDIWPPYDWSGKTHYWYQAAWANDTWGWRGKVCGKAGYHPDVRYFNGWYPSVPAVKFMYRRSSAWAQAGSVVGIGSSLQVVAWIYNGELGGIDWKIMIYDAYLFDEFDVLMTWL